MKYRTQDDKLTQLLVRRWIYSAIALGILVLSPVSVFAQAGEETVPVDAMRCWRRVSSTAVVVGEHFAMTITCSVVETNQSRTLPNQGALEPETIEVLPFDVLNGQRHEDIRTGPYRFFQYQYALRLISESSFGEDVELPALALTYRIERRIGDNPALLGRELTYVLPAEPIRIVSLVSDSTVDIRDLPPATFDQMETRTLRANLLTLLAGLFGLIALSIVALGIIRIAQARGGNRRSTDRQILLPVVVDGSLKQLTDIQQTTASSGWTAQSVGRALAALRITAAVAIARPITRDSIDSGDPTRDGQLRLRHGYLRQKTANLTSAVTAATLKQRLAESSPGLIADRKTVEQLSSAIAAFTAARYARSTALPQDSLTQILKTSIEHTKRLRWQAAAPIRRARQFISATSDWWTWVWTR